MRLYNKIMLYFWLIAGVAIVIGVTYMSVNEGFLKWRFYYFAALLCFGMFILRRWMLKRMDKHLEYLEQKSKDEEK